MTLLVQRLHRWLGERLATRAARIVATLVVLGALGIAVATVQHGRFIATLPVVDRPAEYSRGWALWFAGVLSLVSVMLALYLAFVPA